MTEGYRVLCGIECDWNGVGYVDQLRRLALTLNYFWHGDPCVLAVLADLVLVLVVAVCDRCLASYLSSGFLVFVQSLAKNSSQFELL